jgi:ABC-type sugar transport system ATPase subunit
MATIVLKNVNKIIKNLEVIKSFNLEISDKSSCVIVGLKDCGKTTILRMIAGLENVSNGEILINGKKANSIEPSKRGVAFIFDDYALYPNLTAAENIVFSLKNKGVPQKDILGSLAEIADILKIEKFLGKYPEHLNATQKQKIALARAVIKHPDILIFDTPLSSIESKPRYEMRIELRKFQVKYGFTLIYACDNAIEAMAIGDKICLMKDGEIVQIADPVNAYSNPINKFAANFMGNPFISFFEVELVKKSKGFCLLGDTFELVLPDDVGEKVSSYAGGSVFFSLKAEDFSLSGQEQYIKAIVEAVELQGNIKYIYAIAGNNKLKVKTKLSTEIFAGRSYEFYIDISKIQLFTLTGERIF